MRKTKTTKILFAIYQKAFYSLMILALLLTGLGTKPVRAEPFYTISGNAGVPDAFITFTGGSTTADGAGDYSFLVDTGWTGTVTPSKIGYTFAPENRSYENVQTDLPGQDYTATMITYTISGSTGTTGAGATITYTGGSTTADSFGIYSFSVPHGWSGTVTPFKDGYTFTPPSRSYSDVTVNMTNEDFTAALIEYTISGSVGTGSAIITYTGGSTTANSFGNYSFTVSNGWSGTVTPSKTGFTFWPFSRTYENISANQSSQDYTARPTTFTFASMGDAQQEDAFFADTVNQIADLNPAFALFNGDLEDTGVVVEQMDPMISVLKSANLFNNTFLVRGNHDNYQTGSAAVWESYFETPPNVPTRPSYVTNIVGIDASSDKLTYSFEYGNSIFIGIDVPDDIGELSSEEEDFLNDRLTYAESLGLTHAFIFFHSPEYCTEETHCTCSSRSETACTPPSFIQIINNHPIVSATIHGHEHILGWTHMDSSRVAGLTRSYEQFMTSPSGGVSYNGYLFPERVDYYYPNMTGSDQGFATISVDGDSFTFNIYKTGVTAPVWSHAFSKLNSLPTISDIPNQTTDEDTATGTIPFLVSDVELDPAYLMVTATSSNPTLVPDGNITLGGSGANRTINILPAANQNGSVTITVTVFDGNASLSDTFLLTINPVNDVPVANSQSVSMPWNTSLNIVLTGADLELGPMTFSIVDGPAHGILSGNGESQTYTPNADYSGTDSFTFKVTDNELADSVPATVSIDIYAYTISGNAGVAGATLSYTDVTPKTVTADGTGLYSFQIPAGWSGMVTPSKAGYTFSPASMNYANVQSDQTGQNYTANIIMLTISGNAGVAGATLSYTDGTPKTVTADSSGQYSFEIPYNWSGTVIPSLTGFGFRPAMRAYTNVTSNQDAQDYTTTTSRVYYVDKTNPACTDIGQVGSMTVPFCTIGRGAYLVTAGQIVHVLHGSYAESVFPRNNGSAGNPITFWADPGVTVTGTAPGTGFGGAFGVTSKSYIVIDGFNITNTWYKGIYVDASDHITITNNHVSYAGITSPTHPYEQGIFTRNTSYSTISGNTTDHNTCIGIRVVGGGHNLISNNISAQNYSLIETDAAGIELTGSSYNTVVNNITYSNEDSGINIYFWDTYQVGSTYNVIVGNLSYENGDHGIDVNKSAYNTIVGNTIQGNGTVGINFEGEIGSGSDHGTAINNIVSGNGFTPPAGSWGGNIRVDKVSVAGTTIDYNLYNRQEATSQIVWNDVQYASLAAFRSVVSGQEVNGLEGDPLFVNPIPSVRRYTGVPYLGQGVLGDYYIMAGSPAIDSANADAPYEPLYDIAGNSRIDDPATPNTGAGVRTYDDRGAYEYLTAGASLPVVSTQAVSNITMTTATGNGNITAPGLPTPTQHGVVWGLSPNPTIDDSKTLDGPVSEAGAFTSAITGLIPGTLYHVRAYATNDAGTAYGEDVTFTTHIPPMVTTQAATNITATTASGNGNITSLGVPNPTEHGVVWSTVANPTLADNKTTDGPVSAIGAFTSNITGLTPGTLYHVRAYATNAADTAYGEDVTFTTQIVPTVTTQPVSDITTTTATGNGNITFLGIPNPIQHGVVWSTAVNPTIADSKTTDGPVSVTGAFTSNITGLTPNTLYHVRAYATNEVGTAYGEDVTFTTLEAPTVTTQAVTDINTTTATGNGTITVLGTENPTQHGVVWDVNPNPTISLSTKTEEGPVNATGAFTSAIIGLTPGTLYHVRAYATNIAGTSYGEDVTFTTWILPAVTTQAVTNIAQTTALANGTILNLGVPNPTQYGVTWDINPNPTVALSTKTELGPVSVGGAFTSNITGLNYGQTYHVRAYATNAVGTSYGDDVTFTTLPSDTTTTTPATHAGTGADVSGVGTATWLNAGYITADDTNYAQVSLNNATSHYLQGTNYGFDIPFNAVINGITVTIGRYASGSSGVRDSVVRLLKGGVVAGNDKHVTSFWPSGSPAAITYGNNGDLWGTTWTPTDINASNFGVALAATTTTNRIAYVDYMQIAVTYTVSVVSSNSSVSCGAGMPVLDYGTTITCVATVVRGSSTWTPTGDVAWTSTESGSFTPTSCSLLGDSGTATCSVVYSPGSVGTGSHLITATYPGDANFLGSNSSQTVTVNKLTASVTPTAASKTYGDVDPTLAGTLAGFIPADNVTATFSRTAGETVAGGPYTISATLSPVEVLANYNITYNTADFTINPKDASVTPDAASKVLGQPDPVLTGTLTGFLPADGVTAAYSRAEGEEIGTYPISAVLSPVDILGNYNITYNTASFTITDSGLTAGTYDDEHAAWVYAAGWSSMPNTGSYADTIHYSTTSGSEAQMTFSGQQIKLLYLAGPGSGMVDVYLDGAKATTINQDNAYWDFQKTWTSDLLTAGSHTLRVVHASGSFTTIDAITVIDTPVILASGMYDDTEPAFSYAGRWFTLDGITEPYNSTLRYSTSIGNEVQVSFHGRQIQFTYLASPISGGVEVYLDGVKIKTLNQNYEFWWWQNTWTSDLLPDGDHSLRIVHASGDLAAIDAIRVVETPIGLTTGVYDDASSSMNYEGRWFTLDGITEPYASTLHYSVTYGNDFQTNFNGRQFKLTYLASPISGVADIYVDGTKLATLNQQSETWDWQRTWTSDLVPAGDHSLRIVHASGGFIAIDAIQVVTTPVILTNGTYDDFDAAFSYEGRWQTMEAVSGPYADTLHFTIATTESVQLSFNGQQVALTYLASPTSGVVDVYIDGVKVTSINQYSDSWTWQQTWTSDVLASGDHSLRVVFTSGSSGSFGNIDAVTVIP